MDVGIKNFNGGVFSPLMRGRDEYAATCRKLLNAIPAVQGYVQRRGGTRFVASVPDAVRLIPFVFSASQSYLLVFRVGHVDVYFNRELKQSLESPYAREQIDAVYYYQVQDTMYLAHPDVEPKKIVRKANADGSVTFSIESVAFQNGPYLDENETETTMSFDGTTIAASADVFSEADVGRWVRLVTVADSTTKSVDLKIAAVTNAKTAAATVGAGEYHKVATKLWSLGAFSSGRGYPEIMVVHQQRMVCIKRGALYFSKSGAYMNFQKTDEKGVVAADNGFSVKLAVEQGSEACWAFPMDVLAIGTDGFEYAISSTSLGEALTPTNVKYYKISSVGCAPVRPEFVEDGLVFLDSFRRSFNFSAYSAVYDKYQITDITKFNPQITNGKIKAAAFCKKKQPVLWCCKENGDLIGCTLSPSNQVVAWFDADVSGRVESVCAVPDFNLERTDPYLLVKREINGKTAVYLEVVEEGLTDDADDAADAFFVDSGKSFSFDDAQSELSGLEHLEGQTVAISGDGAVEPDRVVQNGKVSLQFPAKKACVGFAYKTVIARQPDLQNADADKKVKKISDVILRLYKTVCAKAGRTESDAVDITFRSAGDAMTRAVPLFTGDKPVNFGGGWDADADVVIVQEKPMPLFVLAVFASMMRGG